MRPRPGPFAGQLRRKALTVPPSAAPPALGLILRTPTQGFRHGLTFSHRPSGLKKQSPRHRPWIESHFDELWHSRPRLWPLTLLLKPESKELQLTASTDCSGRAAIFGRMSPLIT